MVFFTCNGCGESLKKAQVENHVNICRKCQVLSCIDCGKDFWGDDYKNHNKCISEDQKYGGKGFEAKANKGEVKQQQWIEKIHDAMNKPGVSAKLKDVLGKVSAYDNVPRKKAKFQNWMKNSLKINNTSLHDEVWDILAAADNDSQSQKSEKTNETENPVAEATVDSSGNQNGHGAVDKKKLNKRERKIARQQKNGKTVKATEESASLEPEDDLAGKKKKKDRKRQRSSEQDEDGEKNGAELTKKKKKTCKFNSERLVTIDQTAEESQENEEHQAVSRDSLPQIHHGALLLLLMGIRKRAPPIPDSPSSLCKFNWKGNIKAILRASPDQEVPVKKLRKKVLAAYHSFTGDGNFRTEEDLLALFNKKISNNPKFIVKKERVRLLK
uniref:Cell growth-regulating nucleolar protein n=1 Tax=Tetraodon nigroviridis TaxID=99883 RepID=H3C118_TETNG